MICLIAITEHHVHENHFQKTYLKNRSRNKCSQNVCSYGSYTPFQGHFSQIGTPCVTASVCPSVLMNFEFRAFCVRQIVITKVSFLTKRVKYLKKVEQRSKCQSWGLCPSCGPWAAFTKMQDHIQHLWWKNPFTMKTI